jgi:ketosteroid isomerase-like protein
MSGPGRGRNVEVAQQLAERWNAGDFEGVIALYHEEMEMIPGPEWPDPPVFGKADFARYVDEWRNAWASSKLDLHAIEAIGDLVVAGGEWDNRSATTGIGGTMPFGIVLTVRDGLVIRHQWFVDPSDARRAAGLPA